MGCSISAGKLESLPVFWQESRDNINWPFPFVLPAWLQVWWGVFGSGFQPYIRVARDGDDIIGIAPLMVKDDTAFFIGDTDVCDYQDFPLQPGREKDFFDALLDDIGRNGIGRLDLKHVRPDSTVMRELAGLAGERGYPGTMTQEAVTAEMPLPDDFEKYLASLATKQRHEVRRKLRRLGKAGTIDFRMEKESRNIPEAMDVFFRMFADSRRDKSNFLTEQVEMFFRALAAALDRIGILRIGTLELDGRPVAAVICFDYQERRYLYNCGYDSAYTAVNAGLASKVLTIKDGIESGLKAFDFLKGEEAYKQHLGGVAVPLFRCRISLK